MSKQKVLEQIIFQYEINYTAWFDSLGKPILSTTGIAINLFYVAAYEHFNHNEYKTKRFLKNNIIEIILYTEGTLNSLYPILTNTYRKYNRDRKIQELAYIIYDKIIRLNKPWYKYYYKLIKNKIYDNKS